MASDPIFHPHLSHRVGSCSAEQELALAPYSWWVSFTVLIVCTGNICRSPMAERLLITRLGAGSPVTVVSAGTMALVGHPLDASCAIVLSEYGADPDEHVGRRLTPALIAAADVILTAQLLHRSVVLQSAPLAFRRTFTLREFVRLSAGLGEVDVERSTVEALRDRVAQVAAQRGMAGSATSAEDEIADPFGASLEVMRSCAAQIVEAVDALIVTLGLACDHPVEAQQNRQGRSEATTEVLAVDGSGARSSATARRWLGWFRSGTGT